MFKTVNYIQYIQEDLQLAKAREKERDTAIFVELAEELMEEDCAQFTDSLVVAFIGNYAVYLAKNVQSRYPRPSAANKNSAMKELSLLSTQALRHLRSSLPSIQDRSNVLVAHMALFGMMVWDRLMCYEENIDMSVKFLSLTMQYADVFGYLIRALAKAEPELKVYRCREGHLLVRTILSHIARSLFNGFGSNLAKNVTFEARKKLSEQEGRRQDRLKVCLEMGEIQKDIGDLHEQ